MEATRERLADPAKTVDRRGRQPRWLAGGLRAFVLAGIGLLVLFDALVVAFDDVVNGPVGLLAPLSGIVTFACVAWCRRDLVVATVVAAGCSLAVSLLVDRHAVNPSVAELAGLAVLSAAAVRIPVARIAGVLLVLTGAAMLASGLRVAVVTIPAVVLWAAAIAVGAYLRWLDVLREQAVAAARHDERLALARELHDLVAHYVTGIVVQAQAAQVVVAERPEAARDTLASVERAGGEALAAMRRLVGSLRSRDGAALRAERPAGSAWLHELVQQSNASGVPARLHLHDLDPDALPPAMAASVHRIVQEALANVRRHAVGVTGVDVELACRDGELVIVVRDDGCHTARPTRGGGFGLVGMAERVAALHGRLDAGPLPDSGWQVSACLPVEGDTG